MGKKKAQMRKSKNVAASAKGRDSRAHRKTGMAAIKKNGKKSSSFWPSVLASAIGSILGVTLYFWIAGIVEQNALDRATEQRLYLAYIEAEYNIKYAKNIYKDYAEVNDVNSLKMNTRWLSTAAAVGAFGDANILSFISLDRVSLLKGYIDDIATLHKALQLHQGVLESQGFNLTPQEKDARRHVRSIAVDVNDIASVLRDDLKEYFDEKDYNPEKFDELRDRLELKRKRREN